MYVGRLARSLTRSCLALLTMSSLAMPANAQTHDTHAASRQPGPQDSALVQAVRDATDRFRFVTTVDGPGEGYQLLFGCVSGGDFGAMGLHYVNMSLVDDGMIKVDEPEIVLFEPTPDGGIRITGADYLVKAAQWDATHDGPPELMGQLFHLFDSPNRFGLPAFYTLHVWAWKGNPNGTFVNWNPDVSCDAYNPPPQLFVR
jgi:hypothetical protein